jgi:aminoglycoside phosphotransferase (APT) family kinase protein
MPVLKTSAELIDAALVKQLIETQFPRWADLEIKPVTHGGWDNRTFHLGQHMLVRLPSAAGYVPHVAKEHRWLPALAPHLPVPIPVPLAQGKPGLGYPWPWSIFRWLEGQTATTAQIPDRVRFARQVAGFLVALWRIAPEDGPPAGQANFHRGGLLAVYDDEARRAINALNGRIDTYAASAIWDEAISTTWQNLPVWVHGDVSDGNLLVKDGELAAVIDFGSSAVGDPACDFYIAWTFFDREARAAFRSSLSTDSATWSRGRGWALWKGLITLANQEPSNASEAWARMVIYNVFADHRADS